MENQKKHEVVVLVDNIDLRERIKQAFSLIPFPEAIDWCFLNDEQLKDVNQYVKKILEDGIEKLEREQFLSNEEYRRTCTNTAINLEKKFIKGANGGWFDVFELQRKTKWDLERCYQILHSMVLFDVAKEQYNEEHNRPYYKITVTDKQKIDYFSYMKNHFARQYELMKQEISKLLNAESERNTGQA